MRVVAGTSPALAFDEPLTVLRAADRDGSAGVWDAAEAALRDGRWIAGYVEYEGALALGVFDAPHEIALASEPVAHSPLLPRVDFQSYAASVATLQAAIYEGDVYQVNDTIPFHLHTDGDPFALWSYYAAATHGRYQAYVEDGTRALASWSPELFLEFDGRRVRTKPMKGTATLDAVGALHEPKNRAEHVMIVDLLRNDLRRVCDDVAVERFLEVERYPTFATMTSTIAGELRPNATLAQIFEAAFPCGSITGAPKRSAMRFIERCEAAPRGAYCGAIGFLSPHWRGWWNVAIRTAQFDRATGWGRYDAGGGIVADSQVCAEWNEVLLKTAFLRAPEAAILETFDPRDPATVAAHLARLERSARAFGVAFDPAGVRRLLAGARGRTSVRLHFNGEVAVSSAPIASSPEPVRICLSGERVRSDDPFLRHKTSWRPAHERALRYAAARGCFDAILRNERDHLTEGSFTNLFVEIDGRMWTPPVGEGVLPGILRERLIAEGRVRERSLLSDDLRRASAVYAGNSLRGLLRAEVVSGD